MRVISNLNICNGILYSLMELKSVLYTSAVMVTTASEDEGVAIPAG
jgi:hypothetical protein